jgi:CRISPR-associated protein Cas5d
MRGQTHCLEVWGDFACFTRPETKVERYSYPVITPSAARGIFDAIYFKRSYEFYWQIERVEILELPKYIALRRNEVKDKAPGERTILAWMEGRQPVEPLWADGDRDSLGTDQKGRTQRQTMALQDVRYRLHAHMRFRKEPRDIREFDEQFARRARLGKCFYQPFFGCREFPAYFEPVDENSPPKSPIRLDLDLGWMLYDVFDLSVTGDAFGKPNISVFRAQISRGVIDIPPYEDSAVGKGQEAGHA